MRPITRRQVQNYSEKNKNVNMKYLNFDIEQLCPGVVLGTRANGIAVGGLVRKKQV